MSSKQAEEVYNDLMALEDGEKLNAIVISTASLILSVNPENREKLSGLIFNMVGDIVNAASIEISQESEVSLH
jgi:hypothetical protein